MDKEENTYNGLKTLLQEYLSEDCNLEKEKPKINTDLLEYGFKARYPKIEDADGNPIGHRVLVCKSKNKNIIEISANVVLLEDAQEVYSKLDIGMKNKMFWEAGMFIIRQNLIPSIDHINMKISFVDRLYYRNSDFPSINDFYKSIIRIVNTSIIVIDIVNRYLGMPVNKNINLEPKESYIQ